MEKFCFFFSSIILSYGNVCNSLIGATRAVFAAVYLASLSFAAPGKAVDVILSYFIGCILHSVTVAEMF